MTTGVTLASGVVAGPGAPVIVLQCGTPFIFPSSGSMANNGALSGITALQATFGSCWMNFPAGAIAAGVPAAATTFFVQMSTTQVGIVFNNSPQIVGNSIPFPTNPTAFVTTGPGAFTQTTASNVAMLTVPILGSLIGSTGWIRVGLVNSNNNSAGAKTSLVTFGGSNFIAPAAFTTNQTMGQQHTLVNMGVSNSQIAMTAGNAGGFGPSAGTPTRIAIDTTASQNLVFNCQLATATDTMQYDYILIEAFP